jgi:hypothetical protein
MKKLIIVIILIFIGDVSQAQDVEYAVLRKLNGDLAYSDANGEYLSREAWIIKYGRREFNDKFPEPLYYNHAEEVGYIRKSIAYSVYSSAVGSIEWSRIFYTDATIEQAKLEAKQKLSDIKYDKDNVIIGMISDVKIIPDIYGIASGLYNSALSATVKYEFRDGRYKVTALNIKSRLTSNISVGVMTGGIFIGSEDADPYTSIYEKFYRGVTPVSTDRWLKLSNTIDYNLSNLLRLEIDASKDDW